MYASIVLFTALFFAFQGWRKGFFYLILRLISLLLAYALAWQAGPSLAQYLADKNWLPGVLAWPVAGLVLFVGGSMLFAAVARWLVTLIPESWHSRSKPAGAVTGALLGAGVGLLMVWTAGTVQEAWHLHQAPKATVTAATATAPAAPEQSVVEDANHLVSDWAGAAMAAIIKSALGDGPEASVAAQWARQPVSMSEGLQHLANKPELKQLFQDPASYAVMTRGTNQDIQRLPAFKALTNDPQVIQFLTTAGLPGETLPAQSQAFAGMLSHYAGNFEKLRGTPEFQALAQDPQLREKLQQGNLLALITNDKMRQLADMLVQGKLPKQLPASQTTEKAGSNNGSHTRELLREPKQEAAVEPKPLYRWHDDKGRVHITEDKPPEGIKADVIQP